MTGFLLLATLLLSTPGRIDPHGGHADPSTGNYHFHSGPAPQERYVDGAGLVRFGTGRGGMWGRGEGDDLGIFSMAFLLYMIGAATGAGLLAWWIEDRWRTRRRHRRRHHHAHHKPPPAFLQRIAPNRLAGSNRLVG